METNIYFNSEGVIKQLEYANKAIENGNLLASISFQNCSVLYNIVHDANEFVDIKSTLCKITDNILIGGCGLLNDYNLLKDFCFTENLSHRNTFGTNITLTSLVSKLLLYCQKKTLDNSDRPFGVGLLIIAREYNFKTQKFEFKTIEVNSSGKVTEWNGCAIGLKQETVKSLIEREFTENKNKDVDEVTIGRIGKAMVKLVYEDEKMNNVKVFCGVISNTGSLVKSIEINN